MAEQKQQQQQQENYQKEVVWYCRLENLVDAQDQFLNGYAGSFVGKMEEDVAVSVMVDGGPLKHLVKPENIRRVSKDYTDLVVAVGRENLRSTDFLATVVDQKRTVQLTAKVLPKGDNKSSMRSTGTLKAIIEYFKTQDIPTSGDIVFHVTDLNIALLFNKYAAAVAATGEKELKKSTTPSKEFAHWESHSGLYSATYDDVLFSDLYTLSSNQKGLTKTLRKYILQYSTDDRLILFKYTPFRINRNDRTPQDLMSVIQKSGFHIYPSPCDTFMDALEVRFLLPGRSTHDFFLDFGQGEVIQYIQNMWTVERGHMARLMPECLASMDPQMYWSCILHSKTVLIELRKLFPPENKNEVLVKEWSGIYATYLRSLVSFKDVCVKPSEAVRLLPDSMTGDWNLINDEIHSYLANRNAKLAILMSIAPCILSKINKETTNEFYHTQIELRENYKIGSEIDTVVKEFTKASADGNSRNMALAIQKIMKWEEKTKFCDYCGKRAIFDCSKCEGAGYCGVKCQRAAWPSHKKVCKVIQEAEYQHTHRTLKSYGDALETRRQWQGNEFQMIFCFFIHLSLNRP